MSLVRRHRRLATLSLAAVLTTLLLSVGAGSALAQQSTITPSDCQHGRIKNQAGSTIPVSNCEELVGRSVTLASTGFDAWIVAVGGAACLGAAVALVTLRPRAREG
jgi:hypothetical protein